MTESGKSSGARGYSWEPFKPGNEAAVRHGAWSPRRVEPLARELVDLVLADPDIGYLAAASYRPALWSWATAEVRAQLFSEALADHECTGCKRCAEWDERLRRWQTTAMNHRQRLGLDPLSRARLGRDVAAAQVDVAELLTRLREAAGRREDGDDDDQ